MAAKKKTKSTETLESKLEMLDDKWNSADDSDDEESVKEIGAKKKQSQKKKRELKELPSVASNVVYIGHLPSLFGEHELLVFLKQFGSVVNVRVSRSIKTGGSRGYAFCRMKTPEIATIVADTLSGYLLFDAKQHIRKRLVCHIVPLDKIHPHLFRMKQNAKSVQARRKQKVHEKPSISAIGAITARLLQKEKKKRKDLKAKGIDYDFPGYEASVKKDTATNSDTVSKMKKRKASISATEKAPKTQTTSSHDGKSSASKSKSASSPKSNEAPSQKKMKTQNNPSETKSKRSSKVKADDLVSSSASKKKRKESIATPEKTSATDSTKKKRKASIGKKDDAPTEKDSEMNLSSTSQGKLPKSKKKKSENSAVKEKEITPSASASSPVQTLTTTKAQPKKKKKSESTPVKGGASETSPSLSSSARAQSEKKPKKKKSSKRRISA